MRILIAHVRYRQRGGEDVVVDTEAALLRAAGHDVAVLDLRSEAFDVLPLLTKLQIGLGAGDHSYGRDLVRKAILAYRPDVVHFHNLYPLLGPGAIDEAVCLGCGTVQTLHNYRLSCIAGTHFRDGSVCEKCLPVHHGQGIRHACYRSSVLQSLALAGGVSRQWRLARSGRAPHVLLCLTEFMRGRLIDAGLPGQMLIVRPNGVPGSSSCTPYERRSGVIFVGRLSPEKGILQLVDGWDESLPALRVIGDGPLRDDIVVRCERKANVTYLGHLSPARVREELGAARVTALPSVSYEGGLPLVILESFAEGTPVVGFDHGAMTVLREVDSALVCAPGDFEVFRARCSMIHAFDVEERIALSSRCRNVHASRYSHASSVAGLLEAYSRAQSGLS